MFFPKEYYNMKWEFLLSKDSPQFMAYVSSVYLLSLSLSLSPSLSLSHFFLWVPHKLQTLLCRPNNLAIICPRASPSAAAASPLLSPSVYTPPQPLSGKRKSRIYASAAKNNVAVRLRNPSTSADRRSHTDRRSWIASTQPSQSELLSLRLWSVADRLSLDL